MTEHDRRRRLRATTLENPPAAGVYVIRHRATGRAVVSTAVNLAAARNRFEFCTSTGTLGSFDSGLVADARSHGIDGLELEELEVVPVEAGSTAVSIQADLEVLADLWRERLGSRPA